MADADTARIAFGKAVAVWMRFNSFSQQNIHDWAQMAGTPGPWNSSISLCQRGLLDPKAGFWIGFGQLNQDLHNGNLRYVTKRKLKDKLVEAIPFMTADGRPATATDFFALFIGEAEIAPEYQVTGFDEADALKLSEEYRDKFNEYCLANMFRAKEAWDLVKLECEKLGMTEEQILFMQKVLIGISDYSADQLNELTSSVDSLPLPGKALDMVP